MSGIERQIQAPTAPYGAAQAAAARGSHISFAGSIHAELVKLRSLASTWWILGITVVLTPAIAALAAWSVRYASGIDEKGNALAAPRPISAETLWSLMSGSVSTIQFVIGIFGVMALTTEYTTSSIQSSLTVNPRRIMFVNAKAVAVAITTFLATLLTQALSYAIIQLMMVGMTVTPLDGSNARLPYLAFLGTPVALVAVAWFSLGLGAMLRSTAGAICTLFGIWMILPMVIALAGSFIQNAEWLSSVSAALPDSALSNFLMGSDASGSTQSSGFVFAPNWWQSGLVLLAWTALSYVLGVLVVRTRDVK